MIPVQEGNILYYMPHTPFETLISVLEHHSSHVVIIGNSFQHYVLHRNKDIELIQSVLKRTVEYELNRNDDVFNNTSLHVIK